MSRTAVATHARIAGHPCSGERQSHNAHQKSIYITHTSHPICYRGNDHGPGWPVQPWCVAEPDTTGIRQGCLVCSPEQRHGETRQARVPRLVGMSRWARRGCEVRIAMEPLGHVTRRPAPYGRSLGSRCAGSASIRVRATDPGRPVRHSPTTRSGRAMRVRAVHFTELRTPIDALRGAAGLGRFPWTDPVLTAGATPVRLAHPLQLRQALSAAYAAAGRTAPRWTDATPVAGTTRSVSPIRWSFAPRWWLD